LQSLSKTSIVIDNNYKKVSIEIDGNDHTLDELLDNLVAPALHALGYQFDELYFDVKSSAD